MSNDISLIALLSFITVIPFIVAGGTCFIKFSIVLVMIRNALGVQQVPSNMTLNGIALILSIFVMTPVTRDIYIYFQTNKIDLTNELSVNKFMDTGLSGYKTYLRKYADPELVVFFERTQGKQIAESDNENGEQEEMDSLFSLLPAYALSEIKDAFTIGFYIYLPFVVIDLVISSILLALGMMMMSPVTLSVPIKLILFVAMDGWALLSKGLILQYIDLSHT